MASLTIDELRSFHRIDRELYTRFVLRFRLDAILCMQIFALWLWLERLGFPDMVMKLLPLSDDLVIAVIEEAIASLIFLQSDIPPILDVDPNLPMTSSLMGKKEISLHFIYANRVQAINNITKIVHDICIRVFEDIAQEALSRPAGDNVVVPQRNVSGGGGGAAGGSGLEGGAAQESVVGDVTLPYPTTSLGRGLLGRPVFQHSLIVLPTPTYYPPEMKIRVFQQGSSSTPSSWNTAGTSTNLNPGAVPYNPMMTMIEEVPVEERTVLVTFSRGYPITEQEIREFFNSEYGDCIESLQMQKVIPHIQPLYALLVLYSALDMDLILEGKETVQLTINSKDVLVRRYVGK